MVSERVDPPTSMSDDDAIAESYIRMQGVLREMIEQLQQMNASSAAERAEIKQIRAALLSNEGVVKTLAAEPLSSPSSLATSPNPFLKLKGVLHKTKEMEINALKPNQFKEDEFFIAAKGGDSSLFRALSHDQRVRALALRNDDGRSLLHVATSADRPEAMSILADVDQSTSMINIKGEDGLVPIHFASSIGNVQIVEILLNKGADVNLKNDVGWTALHYAASEGWSNVTEILSAHEAKIYLKDKDGTKAQHRAASTGKSEVCELDAFVDPKALPPNRSGDDQISLKQGTIHPSNTPYSSPVVLDGYPPPLHRPFVPGDPALPSVDQSMREWTFMLAVMRENLLMAQQRMKVQADKGEIRKTFREAVPKFSLGKLRLAMRISIIFSILEDNDKLRKGELIHGNHDQVSGSEEAQ